MTRFAPRLLAFAVVLPLSLASGCMPFGLGGTVDGHDLLVLDVVYYEIYGDTDDFGLPFHDIDVWLTPMEDSCEALTSLQADLTDLREQIDAAGLDATSYCNEWESLFTAAIGGEDFWVGQFRLKAQPRGEYETPVTTYTFNEENDEVLAESPSFDADLAYYTAPTFDACAEEFEVTGTGAYAPTQYGAEGGEASISAYDDDEEITIALRPQFPNDGRSDRGGASLEGQSTPSFCRAAEDWSLVFGGAPARR